MVEQENSWSYQSDDTPQTGRWGWSVLFRPQRLNRVHRRGSMRRDVAGQQGDGQHHGGHRYERGRVKRLHPKSRDHGLLGLRSDFGAETFFLRPQLGRELLAEVVRLEHRANFDFGSAVEWRALEPFDRLLQ